MAIVSDVQCQGIAQGVVQYPQPRGVEVSGYTDYTGTHHEVEGSMNKAIICRLFSSFRIQSATDVNNFIVTKFRLIFGEK